MVVNEKSYFKNWYKSSQNMLNLHLNSYRGIKSVKILVNSRDENLVKSFCELRKS